MSREVAIKKLNRRQKEALIAQTGTPMLEELED